MTDRKTGAYQGCSAIMGTLTNAQKAQKALSLAAIPSSVTKMEGSTTHRGCVWSVSFTCNQAKNVKTVLSSAGINVRAWEGDNDIF